MRYSAIVFFLCLTFPAAAEDFIRIERTYDPAGREKITVRCERQCRIERELWGKPAGSRTVPKDLILRHAKRFLESVKGTRIAPRDRPNLEWEIRTGGKNHRGFFGSKDPEKRPSQVDALLRLEEGIARAYDRR